MPIYGMVITKYDWRYREMAQVKTPFVMVDERGGFAVYDTRNGKLARVESGRSAAKMLVHLSRQQTVGVEVIRPHLVYNPWDKVFEVVDPDGESATITGDHSVAIRMLRAVTEQIEQDRQDQEAQGQQESQQL
jgi:hypothetical protein